jgi:hypothetical protein
MASQHLPEERSCQYDIGKLENEAQGMSERGTARWGQVLFLASVCRLTIRLTPLVHTTRNT